MSIRARPLTDGETVSCPNCRKERFATPGPYICRRCNFAFVVESDTADNAAACGVVR